MYRNDNSNYSRPSYKTKQQRPQQLPPMMEGVDLQDHSPVATSHQTGGSSSFFESDKKNSVAASPNNSIQQTLLPPFANGRASTPKNLVSISTTANKSKNNKGSSSATTPSPSLMRNGGVPNSFSPSSKTRQSFQQKIEESRLLASPSRIDRELKVEVNFIPTLNPNTSIATQNANSDDFKSKINNNIVSKFGIDEEANKERRKILEETLRNAISPSPVLERNEAAAEVSWCRFAHSQLQEQDQFGLNKYAMRRKMRIAAAKERKRRRLSEEKRRMEEEAKTNPEGALGLVRLGSASINRLSARDRLIYHHRRRLIEGLVDGDEEEEELEEEEEEEEEEEDEKEGDDEKKNNDESRRNKKPKKRVDSASLHRQHQNDESMQEGIVKRQLAPPLAQFARKIQQTGKDKFINAYFNEFKDWSIEEMLAAAEAEHGENFLRDAILSSTGSPKMINNNNSSKNDSKTSQTKTTKKTSTMPSSSSLSSTPENLAAMKETLRASFQVAFSPLQVKIGELFKGQDLTSGAVGTLRTFDQRVTFLKKKLLIEEANKRRHSVRFIRDITESLRHDEALFNSFSNEVRLEQIQRIRSHRKAQEIRERERQIFQNRTPLERAEDFRRVEAIKQERAERGKEEIEETYFACCSNALAMRRGAEFSRQCAWSPILLFVLSLQKFSKNLKAARATVSEQRVMKSAQKDFGNIFIPTKVTGFLRLAQGYKEAAKKRTDAAAGLMMARSGAPISKEDRIVMQEIKKKRDHYNAIKKQEFDHPQYMFDRLFAKLRELQFPLLLNRAIRRRRHRSANILVTFLRTLFQQTVIRVRCKCYLRYMRACNAAFLQAVRNRRTRRNFVWGLQFRHYVNERKMYDLPTCVQADHVLKRRERIRVKCAQDKKKAMETVELLRRRLLSQKVEAVVGSTVAKNNAKNNKNRGSDDDDDDDYDNEDHTSSPIKSPMSANNKNVNTNNNNRPTSPFSQASNQNTVTSGSGTGSYQNTRPGTAASGIPHQQQQQPSPIRGTFNNSNNNNNNNNNNNFSPGGPTFYSGINEQSAMNNISNINNNNASSLQQQQQQQQTPFISNPTAYLVHLAQTNPQAAVAAAQSEGDIARILAAPCMVEHPYGKYGPSPREASTVARATMEHFRSTEIKWSPSETSMLALLEFVQRLEDRLVYPQYVEWIRMNRQHKERADFLESVLSHIPENAPTKEDLERQYHTLLETKPLPPRQPYILPPSEMRVIVFAAYTLSAQEKRSSAKAAAMKGTDDGHVPQNNNNHSNSINASSTVIISHHNTISTLHPDNQNLANNGSSCPSVAGMYAFKNLPDGKPNPIYLESNLKSHLSKAMALFPELHGNVRPFILEALKE